MLANPSTYKNNNIRADSITISKIILVDEVISPKPPS